MHSKSSTQECDNQRAGRSARVFNILVFHHHPCSYS